MQGGRSAEKSSKALHPLYDSSMLVGSFLSVSYSPRMLSEHSSTSLRAERSRSHSVRDTLIGKQKRSKVRRRATQLVSAEIQFRNTANLARCDDTTAALGIFLLLATPVAHTLAVTD